jgi:hypothetical protein
MLSVIMISVVMLTFIKMEVIKLAFVKLSVMKLSLGYGAIMPIAVMLSAVYFNYPVACIIKVLRS